MEITVIVMVVAFWACVEDAGRGWPAKRIFTAKQLAIYVDWYEIAVTAMQVARTIPTCGSTLRVRLFVCVTCAVGRKLQL